MDNSHLTKYTPTMQGKYYVLDTTVDPDRTAQIPAMSGRQGDTMRKVSLAFVDDGTPHDLTNSTVELRAQDSAGVVKISDNVLNWLTREGGLLQFGIPAQFYANPGEYQHAYFVITDKDSEGNATSTSTVNVDFEVIENGIELTASDTHIYISSVDRLLETAKDRINAVKLMGDNAEAQLKGYQSMLVSNELPTRQGDNNWTGSNSFANITVDKLNNSQIDSISADLVTAQTTANSASLAAASGLSELSSIESSISAQSTTTGSTITSISASASSAITSTVSDIAMLSTAQSSTASYVKSLSSTTSSVADDVDDIYDSLDSIASQVSNGSSASSETVDVPDYSSSLSYLASAVSSASTNAYRASNQAELASATASAASQGVGSLSSAVYSLAFEADSASGELSAYNLTSMSTAIAILKDKVRSAESAGKL